jgi:hypothetical protein
VPGVLASDILAYERGHPAFHRSVPISGQLIRERLFKSSCRCSRDPEVYGNRRREQGKRKPNSS